MKHLFHITLLFLLPLAVTAQERKVHLDISATAGTTGIGGEIAVQPHPWVTVRAGGTYMPHINVPRNFTIHMGNSKEVIQYDKNGNPLPTKFDKMSDFLEDLTGHHTDQHVRINRRPVLNNGKLLVDLHPLKNKNWHFTTGFYFGGRHFITGENALDEAPLLVGVNIYNNMYQKVLDGESIMMGSKELPIPASIASMIRDYGRMHVYAGVFRNDIYDENGNLLHQTGDQFFIEPDADGEITADCRVNSVRPYLGMGYMGALSKRSDRWKVGFDVGAMFWGGHPSIMVTRAEQFTLTDSKTGKPHTITKYYKLDLSRDVDLSIDPNRYYQRMRKEVNFIKSLQVYPVLEFKLSYRIF